MDPMPQQRQSVLRAKYSVLSTAYFLDILYLALLAIALPWLLYQRLRHGKYREGFAAKFLGNVSLRKSNRPCL
jgi:3-deoxy-D-manno-octulosonic-acid transferase